MFYHVCDALFFLNLNPLELLQRATFASIHSGDVSLVEC